MLHSSRRNLLSRFQSVFLASVLLIIHYGCQTEDSMNNIGSFPIITPENNPYDWAIQYTETYVNLTDVYFVDNMTGWVVGDENTILSTTMGGNTWPQAPVNSYDGNFRSVSMISDNVGWISGDMNGNEINGNIYISSSGGSYPESQKLSDYPLNAIFGLNESLVWSGGENGQLLYSDDGGQNWIKSTTNFDFSINDIYFLDENEGYAVTEQGNILRSTNGGISWELNYEIPEIDLTSVHFIDASKGWACGSRNTILKFDGNAETKWVSIRIENEGVGIVWNDIFFLDKDFGWIVGLAGTVYKTEDGGNIWFKESTGLDNNLNAIHMVNNTTGWIVGEEGIILTYTP